MDSVMSLDTRIQVGGSARMDATQREKMNNASDEIVTIVVKFNSDGEKLMTINGRYIGKYHKQCHGLAGHGWAGHIFDYEISALTEEKARELVCRRLRDIVNVFVVEGVYIVFDDKTQVTND